MNGIKVLLKKFDYELKKEAAKNRVPVKNLLIARNLASVKNEEDFDFYRRVAYGNIAPYVPKDDILMVILQEIMQIQQFGQVVPDNFVELPGSIIDFVNHPKFWKVGKCFICGKKLTHPTSVKMGIGPVCFDRYGDISPLSAEDRAVAGMLALDANDWLVSDTASASGKSVGLYRKSDKNLQYGVSLKNIIYWKGALLITPFYLQYFKQKFGSI